MCSFSNRMFFTKAVSIWTSASDLERLEIVGRYLHQAGGFEAIPVAFDLSPSQNSDPLYVVQGCVKGCSKGCCNDIAKK